MSTFESKQTDPLQNLFPEIEKIIKFMEIKDLVQARAYETTEISDQGTMWLYAQLGEDTYLTYYPYWDVLMFQEMNHSLTVAEAMNMMKDPYKVPSRYHDNLLEKGRAKFLAQYEEKNDYYRMLNGLPPYGTPESEYIYLSEPMRNQLHASDKPIHELSDLVQNSFMATEEYQKLLEDHPDATYLKYLGRYKIDTFTARMAKDFEIIRYPDDNYGINPNLLNKFASLYADYREYIMVTIYNEQFEQIYPNYRNFMGLVILIHTLLQICNASVESVTDRNFLDDSILHLILSMYNIPNTLIFTNQIRRELAIHMLQLTREKSTDEVYYDLIKILGYQDIIISKLMLMKGQQFTDGAITDSNGNVIDSLDDAQFNSQFDPYFIQLDLKDKNPYETIANGTAPLHEYKKIIEGDPTWWDLRDTREALLNKVYSTSDSKYIMVEANIQQMKYMFESIYFSRMILDNRESTDTMMMEIPELFGSTQVSIYDLMVYLLAAMCMNNNLSGEIVSDEAKLLATAGFNFDMDLDSFEEYLNACQYVDKERIRSFMSNLTIGDESDITRLYSEVMYPLREWLEQKISRAENRHEYVEYESIYRAMFTYDINHNSFMEEFRRPMDIICESLEVSPSEIQMYQHFYPRTLSGHHVTDDEYESSRYLSPFLNTMQPVDWYVPIVLETPYGDDNRGILYFHDILNCDDCRKLTNPNGTRIFMDYEDEEIGWQINVQACNKAIELIQKLDATQLYKAYIQVQTPVLDSGGFKYAANDRLPSNIRSGLFKDILLRKLQMDLAGLAEPPKTYQEYLYRKNTMLYNLLLENDRFNRDHNAWLNDVLTVVQSMEIKLNLHLKYFEQSIVGSEMFFKPLIGLIKRFKSYLVDFAKTGLKYTFGDKIDAGGNSNMFKLFDDVKFVVHFVTLALKGYSSQFGLYDSEHSMKHRIIMKDRSEILTMTEGEGFAARVRTAKMGSIHIVDEVKFFLNGQNIDPDGNPSYWITGEPGTGRWAEEDDILMTTRTGSTRIKNKKVDLDGWKDFIPSITPQE